METETYSEHVSVMLNSMLALLNSRHTMQDRFQGSVHLSKLLMSNIHSYKEKEADENTMEVSIIFLR